MRLEIRDDRQMRAVTGLALVQFDILLESFSRTYRALQWQAYEAEVASGQRKRQPGGGRKGALPTLRDKLLFVLYYLKVYPTFDVLGAQFNMARSKANENLHKLLPILHQTLVELEVMPQREFTSPADLLATLEGIETLLVDVTERAYRRPQDPQAQRDHYSGKKKGIP